MQILFFFSRVVITNSTMAIETVDSYPQKRPSINTHLGLKFLCFPHGKRIFPPCETYVSRMGNIRFSNGKHKKHFLMMHNSMKHFRKRYIL